MKSVPQSTAIACRLGVTGATGADPAQATLSFTPDQGMWSVQIKATNSEFADMIQSVLAKLQLPDQANETQHDPSRPRQWTAIIATLQDSGVVVTELPPEDHRVTVTVNTQTGRQVAAYEPLHPFATPDEDLAKRITKVVTETLAAGATELTKRIRTLLQEGDHTGAATAVCEAQAKGVFALPLNAELLDSLAAIDHRVLPPEERRVVLRCLAVTAEALQQHERGRDAANLLLRDADAKLTEAEQTALQMLQAIAMIKSGATESGLIILRRLSRRPDLPVTTRAWTWRNISLALPLENGETRVAAERSADAFLEAGEKAEAARSLGRTVLCAMSDEPTAALATFDRILTIIDGHDLEDRSLRASVLHESAQMLSSMDRHSEAFDRAAQAATLQSGLLGHERKRVASLYLAAFEAKASGLSEIADELKREASDLARRCEDVRATLADRMHDLFQSYSPETADALSNDALAAGEPQVDAAVAIARATLDKTLSDERKVEALEEQLNRVKGGDRVSRVMEPPLLAALGTLLDQIGERDRAAPWLRRAHEADPWNFQLLARLIQNLWDRERWSEAVVVTEKQLQRVGERRGLIYAHARSLFEAGSISRAVPWLRRAYELHEDEPELQKFIFSLLERALMVAGTDANVVCESNQFVPLDEATSALREFASFVSAVKRMRFWTRKTDRAHVWRERPEQYAQDLLHTYLEARFGVRAQILEEIPAGWGRVDLLVRFEGGLTVMVELKMCGLTYSSAYAAAGEEQLNHYMANRRTHIGLLVVIDGRIKDFGKSVITGVDQTMTINELFIDVRPARERGTKT